MFLRPSHRGEPTNPEGGTRIHTEALRAHGTDGLIVTWVDNAGLTRAKGIPIDKVAGAAAKGVTTAPGIDCFLPDGTRVDVAAAAGPDVLLVPDLDRAVPLTATPGWAWAPGDRRLPDGSPYPLCQRGFARRAAEAAARSDVDIQVGIEVEWFAGQASANTLRPVHHGPAFGMARFAAAATYLRDIATALIAQGVDVLQIHPEFAPGQFEVSVAPLDPVTAADTVVLVRETIRAVSLAHALDVSFAPLLAPDGVGNGAHVHISVWRDGTNLCATAPGPSRMHPHAESFVAGVLTELPALLAIATPSAASYLRLAPGRMAGVLHGIGDTREYAVRRATDGGDPTAANVEIKCFDTSANPYLLIGAIIAAGLAGIKAALSPSSSAGITPPPLPSALANTLGRLEQSTALRHALGEPLFEALVQLRSAEVRHSASLLPEELCERVRWCY